MRQIPGRRPRFRTRSTASSVAGSTVPAVMGLGDRCLARHNHLLDIASVVYTPSYAADVLGWDRCRP